MEILLAFGLAALGYAALAARLEHWWISAPLAMAAVGLVISERGLDLVQLAPEGELVVILAELTLVLVLFTDAARIDMRAATADPGPPFRLLGIGMPLTIAAGALLALVLFDTLEFWEAAILAVILAPTDAALGQPVVTSPRVPVRIRRALNIEGGLNDGLAVPLLLLFVALAGVGEGGDRVFWVRFFAEQVGIGALVGLAAGLIGAALVGWAVRSGSAGEIWEGVAVVALPLLVFALADVLGGNGFIAAFLAGAMFGKLCMEDRRERLLLFGEREGLLLELGVFFVFGVAFLPVVLDELTWTGLVYALASLTVIRMIPVALTALGLGANWRTILFIGWFGPRGLASLVLALVVVETGGINGREEIFAIAGLTVALSILLHGLSATPLVERYGAWAERQPPGSAERHELDDMPTRFGTES